MNKKFFQCVQKQQPERKQENGDGSSVCVLNQEVVYRLNFLPEVTTLPSLVDRKYNFLKLSGNHRFVTWSKGHVTLKVEACYGKSPPYLVWWS